MNNTPIMVTVVEDKTNTCDTCFKTMVKHPMCLLILWLVCMIVMSVVISENYSNVDGSQSN